MSELKPCPFCGGENLITMKPTCDRQTPYDPSDRAYSIVYCRSCRASIQGKNWHQSTETAIKAWNTRIDDKTSALLKDAEEVLGFSKERIKHLSCSSEKDFEHDNRYSFVKINQSLKAIDEHLKEIE